MYLRRLQPIGSKSFFLFGARGTGKSTFLKRQFFEKKQAPLYIDLLLPETEDRYLRQPELLKSDVLASQTQWVVLDEIQKLPRLLDVVHHLIESTSCLFALTGSSARKLKRGQANLLAGRALVNSLFPLSSQELGPDHSLEDLLNWGSLPEVLTFKESGERQAYLRSYALTYLREEIQMEQLVRNLDPFRNFLEIAAQVSGKIINFSKIARQVGVDTKTVQNYFHILEDTLIGFFVPAYHSSVRKSQIESPKFYLFDNGVKKALSRTLQSYVSEGTSAFGEAFEHWVIQEIHRLNEYSASDYRLSYFTTKHGNEIDLVLSRGQELILLEIKSSLRVDLERIKRLGALAEAFKSPKVYYLSRDPMAGKHGLVEALHWKAFLDRYFPT